MQNIYQKMGNKTNCLQFVYVPRQSERKAKMRASFKYRHSFFNMDIKPDYANLKIGTEIKKVSPEEVRIKDIIIVKPGEKIPLDGNVIEGNSMVDTSNLTGESVPREVEIGSGVLGGFINLNGLLTIETIKEFGESALSKILDLVQNASSKKAITESFITKFARYYTPAIAIVALLIGVIPPLVIQGANSSEWIYRALVFLVISCPCALVISIPLGFFAGIGGASKRGILVKGSNYLEALSSVSIVVFDKTGTLTKGVFKVTEINPKNGITKDELLEFASYAEVYSNHPIAVSILKSYGKEIDKEEILNYDEISGYGLKVNAKGKEIIAGNIKLMDKENIVYEPADTIGTVIHVAVDSKYVGYILISDEVKEDSAEAIKSLKRLGIKKVVMLTGDNKTVGNKVGMQLGLDEVYSKLLPHEKVEKLEMLNSQKSPKEKLLFIGDGVNDAPVLAMADVGVAMGGLGSDAAIEASDVVIMTDEPSKIVSAIKIARKTKHVIWQNIILALSVKVIILTLGVGGLATMWEAVFGDVGVTIIAVLNAMRVLNVDDL
jgi:Cd2+/Zn2+-exporting ATPase